MQIISRGLGDKIDLLAMINQKKNDLIELGILNGFTTEKVVKVSQELDVLIVTYQKSYLRSI